jgi:serine/threonine protein kinase
MNTPPKLEPQGTVRIPLTPSMAAEDALAASSVTGSLHATPSDTFQRSLLKPHVPGFDIVCEIGHGGNGVVFKARQASLDRIVALKMILAGEFAQPIAMQRFLTEAKVIARIDHPGIIRVHEFGHHQGLPYFALDYLPGGSLAEQLKGRPQQPRHAAALVAKLAEAIQAAHDQGIIHRDLKPGNVLLTGTGEPKITDFGLAKQQDSQLTATGVALGTPCYMSPEQAQGEREVGPLADVYALGAVLYEMLTGRPPFLGVTPLETMARVVGEEIVPPLLLQPATPADLNTICLKCLEKEPHRRYESAAALGADLQRFLDGEPILARPAGRVERGIKWMKRNPGQW